jgi:hypothetical protein
MDRENKASMKPYATIIPAIGRYDEISVIGTKVRNRGECANGGEFQANSK